MTQPLIERVLLEFPESFLDWDVQDGRIMWHLRWGEEVWSHPGTTDDLARFVIDTVFARYTASREQENPDLIHHPGFVHSADVTCPKCSDDTCP